MTPGYGGTDLANCRARVPDMVADFGVAWMGVYLAVAGVLTLIAPWSVRETRTVDLSEV